MAMHPDNEMYDQGYEAGISDAAVQIRDLRAEVERLKRERADEGREYMGEKRRAGRAEQQRDRYRRAAFRLSRLLKKARGIHESLIKTAKRRGAERDAALAREKVLRVLLAQLLELAEHSQCQNCDGWPGEADGSCAECVGALSAVTDARELLREKGGE